MFPHHSPSVCRLLPSRWGSGLKTSSPSFVLHLEILTTEIATPLLWLFLVQRREEKGVARALLRAQLGAKLGFFFLRVLNFQKSLPCLLVCLLHVSHSQPTIKQAIGGHSGSRDCVSCKGVESGVALLVERALILKCAVNPTIGAQQIHAYLPISTDWHRLHSFPGESVATSGSHCFSGWPVSSSRNLPFTSRPWKPELDWGQRFLLAQSCWFYVSGP